VGDEPWARWSLPEVSDLESARGQIALLAELLRAAQQANQRLSERFTEFRRTTTKTTGTEASLVTQVLKSDQAAGKVKDELSWHLGVARRAAWLAERRRSGKS